MNNATLTLDKIQILKKRKNWNLYLILAINHPTDASKKLVRIIPDGHFIDLRKLTNDSYSFVPQGGEPGDGLELICMPLQTGEVIDAQMYIKNHEGIKKWISVLRQIKEDLKGESLTSSGIGNKLTSGAWMAVGGQVLESIGKVMNDIPDRDMGMLSMGIDTNQISKSEEKYTFSNKSTTGEIELTWSWSLDQ